MLDIKTLSEISFDEIYSAFAKAFSDYEEPFDLTQEQLKYMVERRGFNPELSFGAFEGDELVGFTLNGTGNWNGKLTAYDTGTGIIPEYRKKGLATRLFEESLPILKSNGVKQYLLEVIKTNTKAADLYKKAGFEVTREFDYYVENKKDISLGNAKSYINCDIRKISNPDWNLFESMWEFNPSWQNSIDSIKRKEYNFDLFGAYIDNKLVGYAVIEKDSGDLPQLCVAEEYRRKGIGTLLFEYLIENTESENIRIINAPVDSIPFKEFITGCGFKPGFGQYEMLREI